MPGSRAGASPAAAVLLLALLLLPAAPALWEEGRLVTIYYPVVVVLYGLEPRSQSMVFDAVAEIEPYSVRIVFNVSFVEAPSWAVDELRSWLLSNYMWLGEPRWARGLLDGRDVGWLDLVEAYNYYYMLSRIIVWDKGLEAREIVAVIGDVDGYAREYVARTGGYALEGLRGLSGWRPFAFYDLAVVPAPHPGHRMPLDWLGVKVNATSEPPVWMLSDSWGYVVDLVRDHLLYHVASLPERAWYQPSLVLNVYIVAYEPATAYLLERALNRSMTLDMMRRLDPALLHVELRVETVAPAEAGLPTEPPVVREDDWLVIEAEPFMKLVQGRGGCSGGACVYSFYLLGLNGKAFYRLPLGGGLLLNFTGIDLGWAGLGSWPGYDYRAMRSGLEKLVVHELGHGMGLGHPFQRGREARWLMDFDYTVMSYCDNMTVLDLLGLRPYWHDAWKLAVAHSLALLEQAPPGAREEAQRLLSRGMVFSAAAVLVESVYGEEPQGLATLIPMESGAPAATPTTTSPVYTATGIVSTETSVEEHVDAMAVLILLLVLLAMLLRLI